MNRVEELIQQLCPNGVEWKKLGEVCELCRGTVITQKEAIKGNVPVISGGQTPAYFHNKANRPGNTIVVAGSGAYAGFVSFWEIPIFVSDAFTIKPHNELNVKFVFYFLKTIQHRIYATKKGAGIPHVHGSSIQNFDIPIPPLPIQQEIVRILDTLTELNTNLQTELEARKKQYAYYRDCLLNFEGVKGVEWKKLGEVGTFIRGNGLQKKDFTESGIGCIHYGQIYTYYNISTDSTKSYVDCELAKNLTKVNKGDIIIACTSENIEDICKAVAWLGNDTIVTGGHACVFKHRENPKFISYYLQSEFFFQQKKKYARGAKVIDIKASDLAKIEIPIPPLSEQRRIVSILDQFETLVNDLSIGLPAELEARRKQYEYYRDKLLTFDRV